jgi:cation:H+ antiporter
MAPALAIPLFFASLLVTLGAAALFARRLDRLGVRLRMPEALVGLLTALAADGPEISSALVALTTGAKSASLGVLVGSNAFNLAAMIGLSALLAGRVTLRLEALALEGAVGVLATLIASALILGLLPAVAAAILLVVVLVPYLMLVGGGAEAAARLGLTGAAARAVARALGERSLSRRRDEPIDEHSVPRLLMLLPPAVALIVLGSAGMVHAALELGDRWHISAALIGLLILAPATSLPNVFTAVRLGLADRGGALVSETLNSNTINLVVGVAVPALVVSLGHFSGLVAFELAWLLVMTVTSLALLAQPRGLERRGGTALVGLYAVFAAVALVVR